MRRMIDPKQLGGGEEKKYLHHIALQIKGVATSRINFDLINTNPDKYKNISDVYTALGGGVSGTPEIPANGYFYLSSIRKNGIVGSFNMTMPQGNGNIWCGNLEIETVDNVPKIKITSDYQSTIFELYLDNVQEL